MGTDVRGSVRNLARRGVQALRRLRADGSPVEELSPASPDWVAELRTFAWLDDDRFEVTGWAYNRSVDYTGLDPVIAVEARSTKGGQPPVALAVMVEASPEVNQPFNGAEGVVDYSRTCFRATGSVAALRTGRRATRVWTLRITVAAGNDTSAGPFLKRYALGSAAYLVPRRVGERTATPRWTRAEGLSLSVGPLRPTVTAVEYSASERRLSLRCEGMSGGSARLVSAQGSTPLTVTREGGAVLITGVLPSVDEARPWINESPGNWDVPATAADGLPYLLHQLMVARGDGTEVSGLLDATTTITGPIEGEAGPGGALRLTAAETFAVVDSAVLTGGDEPVLRVSGHCRGSLAGGTLVLASERDIRRGSIEQEGTTFHAVIPFLESKWGTRPLPPQVGRLLLSGADAEGRGFVVRCAPAVLAEAPRSVLNHWFRMYYGVASGKVLALRLDVPMTDDEIGTYNQGRIRDFYESGGFPLRDAFYFESFYGRITGCNPLALNDELVAKHPKFERYWAVRDLSVAVPEGAVPVVDGTTAWWRARGECRWLVVNDWLRARFTPREGQTVLQTWHGTMYKKVGLDRGEQLDAEEREFMLGERMKWDLLLSQNPHSTRVFRESYLSNPPIYEEGYPRNDLLVHGSGEKIRELLGIGQDKIVILYAPTWRDDRTELVDYLDPNKLARDLGDRYVVLLRAHSRVIRVGRAAKVEPGVLDVSTYPSTTDMMLISDMMITDYSSMMFDYAVTQRPIIFFTPDLDEYRDQLRGVYLDLEEVGPGPMVSTQADLLETIRTIDQITPAFAERYAQWSRDYIPWDDGTASQRVLARLLAEVPPLDPALLD